LFIAHAYARRLCPQSEDAVDRLGRHYGQV
jgi:hypothetical protein